MSIRAELAQFAISYLYATVVAFGMGFVTGHIVGAGQAKTAACSMQCGEYWMWSDDSCVCLQIKEEW